jgi:hypothetical protein
MKKSTKRAVEIGAGAVTAAAIATAAGIYFFGGENGKKNKAKAKAWIAKARKEIVKNAKVAKHLSKEEYQRLAEKAIKHYGALENMSAGEIALAARELKGEWDHIVKRANSEVKKAHTAKVPKRKKTPARKSSPRKKSAAR